MNAEHKTPEWLKFVDHTADAGIAVEAPDLARLFERAAWGMFSVITDVAAARATEKSRISIDAPDRVALLVRCLSELNYRHVTEHRIFLNLKLSRSASSTSKPTSPAKSSTRRATRFSPRSKR